MEKFQLNVDTTSCIRCGKCVKVCPSQVIQQESKNAKVRIVASENCMSCGHCVAICPKKAVSHSAFPSEKIHTFDRKEYPSASQLALLLKARRSNRAFSAKPVSQEILMQIVEAAHYAPTAHNNQQVAFTLVTDLEKLRQIADYTLNTFRSVVHKLNNPLMSPILRRMMPGTYHYLPAISHLIQSADAGHDVVLRHATAVLFIHTSPSNFFGATDANLAYQNASLMAECLGIGHFYTGLICLAIQQDKKNSLTKCLGISDTIYAGMALGLPLFGFSNYMERKDVVIDVISGEQPS